MNAFAVLGLVAFASLIVQLVLMGRFLRRRRARPTSRVELDKYLESMQQYGWEVRRVGDDAFIASYGACRPNIKPKPAENENPFFPSFRRAWRDRSCID